MQRPPMMVIIVYAPTLSHPYAPTPHATTVSSITIR
jgi:hypothetical protein